jgi:hypothetical protein
MSDGIIIVCAALVVVPLICVAVAGWAVARWA